MKKNKSGTGVNEHLPVYSETASYAREHGELDQWRASHRANVACKDAIEEAIRSHYKDNHLDTACVQEIINAFGIDRTVKVIALTIRYKDWDERFSINNKTWAKSIALTWEANPMEYDHNREYVITQTHPGLVDLFARHVRVEHSRKMGGQ